VQVRQTTPLPDIPSPAVVQQSFRKVDTWLRHHAASEAENHDVGHRTMPENQLKRKLIRGEADSAAAKRRVTESDSCSLPSGTFTSDDEEDEVEYTDDRVDCAASKDQSVAQRRVLPATPFSSPFRLPARPRMSVTSPRRKKRSPVVSSRRRRRAWCGGVEAGLSDVSSGALGDCSSSLATSGDLAAGHRQPSTAGRTPTAAKTTATSRKNVVERRREVLRRVTRMARRLHRVAAADVLSDIHVQTLAVL